LFLIKDCQKNILKISQKFYLRNTRKLLSKKTYFYNKTFLKKVQNQAIMFVRAPKHFKSGKQHVFFFESIFLKTYVFNSVKLLPSIFFLKPNILFNLTLSKLSTNTNNSMKISRLTYTCDIVFKYVMWLVFFFYK
jgi:hypothetical protein